MEAYKEKILVVDYDDTLKKVLIRRLTLLGYKVSIANTGRIALEILNKEEPNLVILDLLLPEINGYEVCLRIREKSKIPIIILTGLDEIPDRITGLELGADDYLIKPFAPKELEARISSVLRRYQSEPRNSLDKKKKVLYVGNTTIDLTRQQVVKNGLKLNLTDLEFSILELLINNAGKSLSRKAILESIWGFTPERDIDTRVVDVHISRLRSKLEEFPSNPDLILTVRGLGYRFHHSV